MNKLSAKKKLIGMILLPAFFSGAALAHETGVDHDHGNTAAQPEGYASEGDKGVVWRSTSDLGNHCWRTGYWDESLAIVEGCDGYEKVAEAKPEPAPAPIPAPQKLTFSADALFDFDSATLKPNGKVALDDFVRGLEGVNYDVIVAVGHADRIGNPDYNQRLSVRRAESVKTYLMSKGIADSRIFTDGKGETQPVTGSECQGKTSRALKECLAPDRRVEIEVAGTR